MYTHRKRKKHFLLKIFFWGLCFSLGKIVKVSRVISNSSLCLWCITLKISIPYLTEPTVSLLGTLKSWLLYFSLVSLPIRHKLSVNWQTYYHFHLSLLVKERQLGNLPGVEGQTSALTDPQKALCQLLEVLKTTLLPHRILVSGTSCQGTCRLPYCSTEQETGCTLEDTTSHKPGKDIHVKELKDLFKKRR